MAAKETPERAKGELKQELKTQGMIMGGFVGLLWVIQIINAFVFQGGLANFGVHPRSIFWLVGILFAPFIHASFAHLIANTVPLAMLGWFVMLRRKRDLFIVSALAAIVGGLGTWLIAPAATVHVGASVLIFGYLGYLLFRGIFERRIWSILGSLVVFFLYGGALFGVLPGEVGVSWQGHLFGLIGGIVAARMLRRPKEGSADAKKEIAPTRAKPALVRAPEPAKRLAAPLPVAPTPAEEDDAEEELAELKKRMKR